MKRKIYFGLTAFQFIYASFQPVFSQKISNNDYYAITLQQDTVNCFDPTYEKTLLIFASTVGCLQCFNEIESEIGHERIDT